MTRQNRYVGKFTFHSVGHGLFYSGIIKNLDSNKQFSFIYDCGGDSSTVVNEAIEVADLPEKIDLLIVSHFHADHINGISKLKNKYKIKRFILPYMDETEKIVYLAALGKENQSLKDFILQPDIFLNDNNVEGDSEIFFVNNNSGKNIPREDDEQKQKGKSEFDFSWENYEQKDNRIICVNTNYTSPTWIFKFFIPKRSSNFNKLKTFFKNEKITCDNAIEKYETIKNKMKELGLNNNISNLVCAHGPAENMVIQTIHNNKNFCSRTLGCVRRCEFYLWHCPSRYLCEKNIGFQFLTGDAEIDNQKEFLNKYCKELEKSILFQVPHHGSKRNWHDWFSEYQPFCKIWPITHNANHKYRKGIFPSAIFSYIFPYSVTEVKSTRLGIEIFFTNI